MSESLQDYSWRRTAEYTLLTMMSVLLSTYALSSLKASVSQNHMGPPDEPEQWRGKEEEGIVLVSINHPGQLGR